MEVEDIVKELVSEEKSSRKLIDDAGEKAKEITSSAEKTGKELVDSKVKEANESARQMIGKAEEEARDRADAMKKKANREIADLKERYREIKEEMISRFLAEIVRGEGR